ncbi:MAG: hypothetical protein CSA22_03980 [Deltaproteobacteria bacterium]|nr:MAG: hypothetical protein CSA22_03980 [Deltaproteobacteria bacterium]
MPLMMLAAQPGLAANGDRDSFGYTYYDNASPSGPKYEWTDISKSGTCIEDKGSDFERYSKRGPFNIGFSFRFYGGLYSKFYILGPGIIAFTQPNQAGAGSGDRLPNPNAPSRGRPTNMIAALWDYLDPGG